MRWRRDPDVYSYFGYGANSSREFIETLLGRCPPNVPAVADNYALYIHPALDAPRGVYEALRSVWGGNFRIYFLRHWTRERVRGTLWHLSPEEKALLDQWNFVGPWYQLRELAVVVEGGATIRAVTETARWNAGDGVADGMNYESFLNGKEKTLTVAREFRAAVVA